MIDPNKIFEIFDYSEGNEVESFDDFIENPQFLMGMYKKIVLNDANINISLLKTFKKIDKSLDIDDIKNAGEYIVYSRAWSYVSKINIENEAHSKALLLCQDDYFKATLNMGINYFESIEEYEKCSYIKKILDFLKTSP